MKRTMKKYIYMILAAAIACSCQIEKGVESGRTEQWLETYATSLFVQHIQQPAAAVNLILDGDTENAYYQHYKNWCHEVSPDTWEMKVTDYFDGTHTTKVTYLGDNYDGKRQFAIEPEFSSTTATYQDRTHIAVMTYRNESILLTDPQLLYSTQVNWMEDIKGIGEVTIDFYMNDIKVDYVTIHISETGSTIECSLD